MLSLLLEFCINGCNSFILLTSVPGNILSVSIFHQTIQLRSIRWESLLVLNGATDRISSFLKIRQLHKIIGANEHFQIKIIFRQKGLCFIYRFNNTSDQFLLVNGRISSTAATNICSIISKCFSQCFDNADVINNQSVALTFGNAVCTCNCLHEGVGFQRFIKVQAAQTLHIKSGKPHGTDKDNSKRILGIFKFLVQLSLLHLSSVVFDIQIPFLECLNFILFLTDDNSHLCFLHPFQFALQFLRFLLGGRFDLLF